MDSSIIKYGDLFDERNFPPIMCDIAAICGTVATLMYAKEFGGVEIYVQKWKQGMKPSRETLNMLKHMLPADVEAVSRAFGGEKILIRKCTGLFAALRNHEISNLNEAGVSRMDIARSTGRSIRHIRGVCNG